MGTESNYKRTLAGSVGAGVGAIFSASGRTYYIIEHKTTTTYHNAGDSDKIIVDQVELGRDSSCQIRFDESCETVSRKHAAIVREGENWKIIPLSQTNATYVNSVPVQGEKILNSGDEIRLSSRGPVMGFIIPSGTKSLVKSIGMTERMNLFRKQALAPYKKGLWTLGILLFVAIVGFVGYGIWSSQTISEQGRTIVEQGDKIDEQSKDIKMLDADRVRLQKELKAQKDALNEQNDKISMQQDYVDELELLIAVNDSIHKAAQEAFAVATAEQKAQLQEQIDAAKKESADARKKATNAIKQLNEYKEAAKAQAETIQQKEEELMDAIKEQNNLIMVQQSYINELKLQIAINDSILKAAEAEFTAASEEQKAKLQAQIDSAKYEATEARQKAAAAIEQLNEYKENVGEIFDDPTLEPYEVVKVATEALDQKDGNGEDSNAQDETELQ